MDKVVLSAVAEVLKEERSVINGRIGDILNQVASLEYATPKELNEIYEKLGSSLNALRLNTEESDAKIADRLSSIEDGLIKALSDDSAKRDIESIAESMQKALDELCDDTESNFEGMAKSLAEFGEQLQEKRVDEDELIKSIEQTAATYFQRSEKTIEDLLITAESKIDAKLATVKDGTDGKDGSDGSDGRDGIDGVDRQLIQPIEINEDQEVKKGSVVYHRGGLFQAVRNVVGDPRRDPHGWSSICDGIADVYHGYDKSEGKHSFEVELTTGKKRLIEFDRAPSYLPPGEYKSIEGDFYLDGTTFRLYRENEWLELDIKGDKGETGEAGKEGARGRKGMKGVGIDEIIVVKNTMYITLTDGEVKEFTIDIAQPEEKDIDSEIRRYAGSWHSGKSYAKGDVVTSFDGLWLCLKNTSEQPSGLGDNWVLMHGGSGGGGGGGGGDIIGVLTQVSNLYIPKNLIAKTSAGAASNGFIPALNTNGKIDSSFLNIPGGMTLRGSVDVTLAPPAGVKAGDYYVVGADGTLNAGYGLGAIVVKKSDTLLYTGTDWIENTSQVDLTTVYTKAEVDARLQSFSGGLTFQKITAADYNALPVKDLKTLYLVSG